MAITGKFLADFTAFQTAVQKAEVSLKGMETGAGKVGTALNKMVDSFSGRKLIQDATLATEAVNRIGGATKLTANEQAALNARLTEALAKMKALGIEGPKAMQDLANATKQVATHTQTMAGPAASAGLSFKTLFSSFTAAGLATTAITKLTSEVTALAEKGLRFPAIEAGFERLSRGVGQNSAEMLQSLQTATKGMVSEFDLMQSANKALLLGLPVTKESMGDMAKAATALGRAMGMDATQSLDDLITALGRSSPMILDNLGLTVKLGEANEAYAAKLGKSSDALTDAEKKIAFYEAAMEAARRKTEQLGDQTKTLSEILQSTWTTLGNSVTKASGDFNVGVGRMLSSWSAFIDAIEQGGGSLPGAIHAAAAQEKFEQLDRTLKQSVLANPPKGFFEVPKSIAAMAEAAGDLAGVEKELDISLRRSTEAIQKQNQQFKAMVGHADSAQELLEVMQQLPKASDAYADALEKLTQITVKTGRESQAAGKAFQQMFSDAVRSGAAGEFSKSLEKNKALLHEMTDEEIRMMRVWRDGMPVVRGLSDEFSRFGMTGQDAVAKVKEETEELLRVIKQAEAFGRSGFARGFAQLSRVGGTTGSVFGGIVDIINQAQDATKAFELMGTAGISTAAKVGAGFSAAAATIGVALAAQSVTRMILDKIDKHAGLEAKGFLVVTGQLRDMNLQLRLAGVNTEKLFAIKDQRTFTAAFEKAKNDIARMDAAMQSFGLTWRDFAALTQEFVTQAGRDLVTQFDHFINIGGDAEKILKGMSGAMSQLVVDAVKTGSKLPSALRPLIEQLIRTKQLSEEAAAALLGITRDAVPAFADIEAAANRYGIEIDALGNAIQQIRIDEIAAQIVKDFNFITKAGGDVNAVLAGMADEVQEVVNKALALGISLPSTMKPILQAMIDAGLLTDQFGNKLKNLDDINFETPLVDKISELIDAIKELINETDRFGDRAVHQFGRARNAAEATGTAIPKGFAPPPGGTATDDNRAVPRPGREAPPETEAAAQGLTDVEAQFDALQATARRVADLLPGSLEPFIDTTSVSVDSTASLEDALRSIGDIDVASPLISQMDWLNRTIDATLDRIRINVNELVGDLEDIDRKWLTKIPPAGSVRVPDEERWRAFQESQAILQQAPFENTQPAVVNNYYAAVERAYGTVDERFADDLLTTVSGGRMYTRYRQVLG